ncbi:MAG TPA: hypothetical protein VFE14_02340 [Micromonosporaceae bacterium]|jgi:hypothetical protein|nr:hypothetical protein [Micromonosporaceae bacterium]
MNPIMNERPSTLPAAFVQVVGVPASSAALAAHVCVVGRPAVWTVSADGDPRIATVLRLAPKPRDYQGTSVSVGQGIDGAKSPMGGVSGVPPRGRPV